VCIVCFIFRNEGYIATRYSVVRSATELQCGDHIACPTIYVVLSHHAIVLASMGDNMVKVIHVKAKEKRQDDDDDDDDDDNGFPPYEVVEELIDVGDHIKMGNLWRYEYEPDKCYDPDEVIMRAKTKLGKFEYNALENNCEHFARWCKTNENASVQSLVVKIVKVVVEGIGALFRKFSR